MLLVQYHHVCERDASSMSGLLTVFPSLLLLGISAWVCVWSLRYQPPSGGIVLGTVTSTDQSSSQPS